MLCAPQLNYNDIYKYDIKRYNYKLIYIIISIKIPIQ